jgi:hypothetical protein
MARAGGCRRGRPRDGGLADTLAADPPTPATIAAPVPSPGAALIGYARCSTDKQDLAAQRAALETLGVAADRIYVDHGLTGTTRARPGLDQALAAVRAGDTLVVPKLDRLARSVPDARAIADALAARGVKLQLGSSLYDPHDPMGKMFFNILATFAEFEADLLGIQTYRIPHPQAPTDRHLAIRKDRHLAIRKDRHKAMEVTPCGPQYRASRERSVRGRDLWATYWAMRVSAPATRTSPGRSYGSPRQAPSRCSPMSAPAVPWIGRG